MKTKIEETKELIEDYKANKAKKLEKLEKELEENHKKLCRMHALCARLEKDIEDEAEARKEYYETISEFIDILDQKDIAVIREIIGDEQNHSEKLKELVYKYAKIKTPKD
jgi:rubrerythrin